MGPNKGKLPPITKNKDAFDNYVHKKSCGRVDISVVCNYNYIHNIDFDRKSTPTKHIFLLHIPLKFSKEALI